MTLASLLTVLLLAFAPAASACEIRCDQASQGASCHSGMKHSSRQQHDSMPSMPGLNALPLADTGPVAAIVSEAAQTCVEHVCAPLPGFLHAQAPALGDSPLTHQMVFLAALQLTYVAPYDRIAVRGPPPSRMVSPVSLRTTLRI